MRVKGTALLLGIMVLASSLAMADERYALGDVRTFEVHQFEKNTFSSGRDPVPPELVEYTRTAIQNDERLTYRSPGDGVLHFYCDSLQCGRVRVELTQGTDGPVVWKTYQKYHPMVQWVEPNGKKFAKTLVNKLAEDYQQAVKEIPAKIPINE